MISVASLGVSIFGRSNQIIHERSTGPRTEIMSECRATSSRDSGAPFRRWYGCGAAREEVFSSRPVSFVGGSEAVLVIEDTPMPKTGETDLMIKNTMPASSYQGD